MGESLIETRRRIQTIQSTEKITKAMKLVSSVKFQRWKKRLSVATPYYESMHEVMLRTLPGIDLKRVNLTQYLGHYDVKRTLYVVVTSSLGLCGSYNYNIYRTLDPLLQEDDVLIVIGEKGYTHYKEKTKNLVRDYVALYDVFDYDNVRALRHYLFRRYREEKYSAIKLIYTHYKNSMVFEPKILTLAPLDLESLRKEKEESIYPPIYEPDSNRFADLLLPHYADSELYYRLTESELSEQASRRNAMETATDNADDMLSSLRIQYNKARQNAITQEITEVVAGANAGNE